MTLTNNILLIIAITFLPFLELRASIPYGILILKMHWLPVFVIAIITNIILGPIVYFFLDKVIHIFLRIRFIDKIYQKYVERTQKSLTLDDASNETLYEKDPYIQEKVPKSVLCMPVIHQKSIIAILYLPNGLVGLIQKIWQRISGRKHAAT